MPPRHLHARAVTINRGKLPFEVAEDDAEVIEGGRPTVIPTAALVLFAAHAA